MAEADKDMNQQGNGFNSESLDAPLDGIAQWVDRWEPLKRLVSLQADKLDMRLQREAELQAHQEASVKCGVTAWPGVGELIDKGIGTEARIPGVPAIEFRNDLPPIIHSGPEQNS